MIKKMRLKLPLVSDYPTTCDNLINRSDILDKQLGSWPASPVEFLVHWWYGHIPLNFINAP